MIIGGDQRARREALRGLLHELGDHNLRRLAEAYGFADAVPGQQTPLQVVAHEVLLGLEHLRLLNSGRELFAELRKLFPEFYRQIDWAELACEGPAIAAPSTWVSAQTADGAVRWLERHYPKVSMRRGLLEDAEVEGDPKESWAALVGRMGPAELRRVLEVARREEPEDITLGGLLDNVEIGVFGALAADGFGEALDRQIEAARALIQDERFAEAVAAFEAVLPRIQGLPTSEPAWRTRRARVELNLASALLQAEQPDRARSLLDGIELAPDDVDRRVTLARLRLEVGDTQGAASAIVGLRGNGATTIEQLLGLLRGEVPEFPVDDAQVLLQCGITRLNQRRSAEAVDLVERALARDELTDFGHALAAQVLYIGLNHTHLDYSLDPIPVSARGRLIAIASGLLRGATAPTEPVWRTVLMARAAVEQVPQDEHGEHGTQGEGGDTVEIERSPWHVELDAIVRRGDTSAELEALIALDQRYPGRMLICFVLAQSLRIAGRAQQAAAAAQEAFRLMPGRGQRNELLRALVATAEPERAWALLDEVPEEGRDDDWYSLACWAAPMAAPGAHVTLATRWTQRSPDHAVPWAALTYACYIGGDTAGARAATRRAAALNIGAITLEGLRPLALTLMREPDAADLPAARALAAELERRGATEPAAEALLLELFKALGQSVGSRPADVDRLIQTGAVLWIPPEHTAAFHQLQALRAASLDRRFEAGDIAHASWVEGRGLPVGATALAVGRGEMHIPTPLPVQVPRTLDWRGAWCVLGELEIEVLAGLGLLKPFGDAIAGLALSEATWARLVNGTFDVTDGGAARLREALNAVLPVTRGLRHVPAGEATSWDVLDGDAADDLRGWLQRLGHRPGRPLQDWTPPSRCLLGSDLLLKLGRDLKLVTEAATGAGVLLGVTDATLAELEERVARLDDRAAARALAQEVLGWLGGLREAGRMRVLRPASLDLPPARPGQHPFPDAVARAGLEGRLAVAGGPDLVLIFGEHASFGLDGQGPAELLMGRAWNRENHATLRARLTAAASRAYTLGEVIAVLAPDQRLRYARTGAIDGLDTASLLALFRDYNGLSGAVPSQIFERQTWFLAGARRLGQQWAAFWLCTRVWAESLWRVGCDSMLEVPERARWVPELLDAVARAEAGVGARFRLVEGVVAALVMHSAGDSDRFYVQEGGHNVLSSDTPGSRLWAAVAAWAMGAADRQDALRLGVALGLRRVVAAQGAGLSRSPAIDGVLLGIASALPVRTDRDLGEDHLAVLAQLDGGLRLLDQLQDAGGSVRARRRAAQRALAQAEEIELRGLMVQPADAPEHALPLELAVFALSAPASRDLAASLLGDDARLALALRDWANMSDSANTGALRAALLSSPLRRVRADPTSLLAWPNWGPEASFPSDIAQLRALLLEPEWGEDTTLGATLLRRIEPGGAWAIPGVQATIIPQLLRIPGMLAVQLPAPPDELEAADRLRELSVGEHLPAGVAGAALRMLVQRAAETPILNDVDLREEVPRLLARLFGPPEPYTYAALEPALVRVAGEVVSSLDALLHTLTPSQHTWLSWRLYAWIEAQIREADKPGESARRLAAKALPPVPPESCVGDLYDPARAGTGRVDLRELTLLQALAGALEVKGSGMSWAPMLPVLHAIATRPFTEDERRFRQGWEQPSLDGIPMVGPDLALWLLIRLNPDALEAFTPEQRLSRLGEALQGQGSIYTRRLVLAGFVERPERWSAAERVRISQAVGAGPVGDTLTTTMLVFGAWFAGDEAQSGRAVELAREAIGAEDGPIIWSYFLSAAAQRGVVAPHVQQLRARCDEAGLDPVPYLRGLVRALVRGGPQAARAAREVLLALADVPMVMQDQGMANLITTLRAESTDAG